MGVVQQRIADVAEAVRLAQLPPDVAVDLLAGIVEPRSDATQRRSDGSFFTAPDVAIWLTRRAIGATLLELLDAPAGDIDAALADGADLTRIVGDRAMTSAAHAAAASRLAELRVLDPSCGAGAFLVAAWGALVELQGVLDGAARVLGITPGARVRPAQLLGVDRDPDAIAACAATLAIVTGASGTAQLTCADSIDAGALPAADIVVGNPPFVRAAAARSAGDLRTAQVPNMSAWIVERALEVLRPNGRIAMVLPISTICTSAFEPARAAWRASCDRVHVSSFDTIPASLFPGVVQRLALVEGHRRVDEGATADAWHVSRYHRWAAAERPGLLDRVRHVAMPAPGDGGSLPKVGSPIELALLAQVRRHAPAGRFLTSAGAGGDNVLHYKRRWSYFLLFTDFVPPIWDAQGEPRTPSEFKTLHVVPELDARVLLALYSSTLFWWYFAVFTDNRNVNLRDLRAFPVPEIDRERAARLATLGDELMVALRACSEVRTCTYRSIGTIRNTYFRQGATRPVLDRIDEELAAAYGLDDAQLDFLLGFERRFRS
ncbi:MAG: hypothetical protein JWM90_1740 [Thermoleophilia bacterium]|nr:hypothetical protein [Thermoleophilia bacterium]